MSKQDIPVTPAIRELRAKKIDFEVFQYTYEEKGGTRQTAELLKVNENNVVKTLIFDADGELIIVLMHGDCEVSAKEVARILGVKKVEPADERKATNATGYQFGGTSPFGTRRKMEVYVEQSILDLDNIYINSGKRGLIVKISPSDLSAFFDLHKINVAIK